MKFWHGGRFERAAGLVTLVCIAGISWADTPGSGGGAPSTPGSTNAAPAKIAATPVKAVKKLSGAELYSMHCARCHPERYPAERTSPQWKTIAMHMRVRANLPASQTRTLLQYLQENSTN
jgi:hypothetical protein